MQGSSPCADDVMLLHLDYYLHYINLLFEVHVMRFRQDSRLSLELVNPWSMLSESSGSRKWNAKYKSRSRSGSRSGSRSRYSKSKARHSQGRKNC